MITISLHPTSHSATRPRRIGAEFSVSFGQIMDFIEDNNAQDCAAYLANGNGLPELYLVQQSGAYDFELGDKLSDFGAAYISRGMLGAVTLLPASTLEELAAYFDLNKVIRIDRVQ